MTSGDLTIRTATAADANLLSTLLSASYAGLAASDYDAAQLAAALPAMSRANPTLLESGTYYVVFSGPSAAGCGGWSFAAPGTGATAPGVAHIRHFATHPDHQRKGVARLLLDRCLAEAAAAGATVMKSQSTLPGEAFYAAAGFRRVRADVAEMGPGIPLPVVLMERPLP